jgi:hypothetical protein
MSLKQTINEMPKEKEKKKKCKGCPTEASGKQERRAGTGSVLSGCQPA